MLFFSTKKKWNMKELLYWEGPKGSCLVSVLPPLLSLILLSPEEPRDGTEKGIQFWIERSIMNSSGNSVLGGLGFRRAEVFSKPKMGESGGGAQRGRGRTSHWTEVSGPPETGLWAKHMALIFEPPGLCPGR